MTCNLCGAQGPLTPYSVSPATVSVCATCQSALEQKNFRGNNHWECVREAMWSELSAVKVLSYRILQHLRREGWASDLLDQIYLEDAERAWAEKELFDEDVTEDSSPVTKDSNGAQLLEGDSVTLIKDLEVKGAGFTAKRGTLVKGIRLTQNPEQIDARVNGIQIVLLTKFLKKV